MDYLGALGLLALLVSAGLGMAAAVSHRSDGEQTQRTEALTALEEQRDAELSGAVPDDLDILLEQAQHDKKAP